MQEQNKLNAAANWQLKTDQKIKALNINVRFEALKLRRQADLDRRQAQLADKLAAEEQALQQELLNSRTTPEQRRAELTARARSLAAKREAERQQLAQQLYEQQFRESCDLLRGKESQIATHDIQHIQQQQVTAQQTADMLNLYAQHDAQQAALLLRPTLNMPIMMQHLHPEVT